jgi:soluble lytic murein transglycosylase-like protein
MPFVHRDHQALTRGIMSKADVRYSRRGLRERRNERIRRLLLLVGLIAAVGMLGMDREGVPDAAAAPPTFDEEMARTQQELADTREELQRVMLELDRANTVLHFSARYKITADLAASIHDIAVAEGLEPELGFRVVRVESQFKERATSPVGAVGLAQVMPSTARYLQPDITVEQLYDRETNLRIGFRYLRGLIREYKGDVRLALLAYNRGPVAVNNARAAGLDPTNGYERVVLRGYTGSGVLE